MIVRITQTVKTEIEVATNDHETAISMVKGHFGEIVDQQYGEPEFDVIPSKGQPHGNQRVA